MAAAIIGLLGALFVLIVSGLFLLFMRLLKRVEELGSEIRQEMREGFAAVREEFAAFRQEMLGLRQDMQAGFKSIAETQAKQGERITRLETLQRIDDQAKAA